MIGNVKNHMFRYLPLSTREFCCNNVCSVCRHLWVFQNLIPLWLLVGCSMLPLVNAVVHSPNQYTLFLCNSCQNVSGNGHGPTCVLATWLLSSACSCIIFRTSFFSPRGCLLFWTSLVFTSSAFDREHILWHLKSLIYHKITSYCIPCSCFSRC